MVTPALHPPVRLLLNAQAIHTACSMHKTSQHGMYADSALLVVTPLRMVMLLLHVPARFFLKPYQRDASGV